MKAFIALFIFVMVVPVCLNSSKALGDEFNLIPSLDFKQEYNDNIFYTKSGEAKKDDFISTVSPGLRISERTPKINMAVSGHINTIQYFANDELNDCEQFYSGEFGFTVNPRINFLLKSDYSVDSNPDRDLETSGIILRNIDRKRFTGDFAGSYVITEKISIAFFCGYEQDDYKEGDVEKDNISDLTSNSISLQVNRYMTEKIHGRITTGYSKYDFSDSDFDIDYYFLTLGASKSLAEALEIGLDIGAHHTEKNYIVSYFDISNFRFTDENQKIKSEGGIGSITLSWGGEYTKWKLSLSHDIKATSGRGGATERTYLGFDINSRLSDELKFFLYSSYYLNRAEKNELSSQDIDEETFRINPWLSYKISRDFFFKAGYIFSKIEYKNDDRDISRNIVFIELMFKHKFFD